MYGSFNLKVEIRIQSNKKWNFPMRRKVDDMLHVVGIGTAQTYQYEGPMFRTAYFYVCIDFMIKNKILIPESTE